MALLQSLGKLIGGAAGTVNNDVVHPVASATQTLLGNRPLPNQGFVPAPMQHINLTEGAGANFGAPELQTQAANYARINAQKQLQFTPAFTQNLVNANAYTGKPPPTQTLLNQKSAGAEYFGQQPPNQIVLSPNQTDPNTILHEGLHRVYDTNPQVRQQFVKAYNQSVTPAIKNYLTAMLHNYVGFSSGLDAGGVPITKYDLNNISNLPQNLQNEAHSFLAEYPGMQTYGGSLPTALNSYYSKYFNPNNSPLAKQRAGAMQTYLKNLPNNSDVRAGS